MAIQTAIASRSLAHSKVCVAVIPIVPASLHVLASQIALQDMPVLLIMVVIVLVESVFRSVTRPVTLLQTALAERQLNTPFVQKSQRELNTTDAL